jgi:hypothetical protein
VAVVIIALWPWFGIAAAEQDPASVARVGIPVADVVDRYRQQGYRFAYSTTLLSHDVVVLAPPQSADPVSIVTELLSPYEIVVELVEGVHVIHRSVHQADSGEEALTRIIRATPPVPELVVSASRYEILRSIVSPGAFIDQQQIETMPILGDDPVRAAQLLPGVASSGVSAKSYVRGSEARNTGIILNGNELLEPYHVRNFQSLFSGIDSRAIDGIEVFSGNIPVRYGNHTGGMMVIDTMEPPAKGRTELGLSVFNTSVLSTGAFADDRAGWLLSGRRGNLDLVIDQEYGEPHYNDFLGQVSVNFSDSTAVSFNAFVANDDVNLVTEDKPTEPEASTSTARNAQFWINWRQQWNDELQSMTTLSVNDFSNDRVEFANDPEEIIANLNDSRDLMILRLNQHWTLEPDDSRHRLGFGFRAESLDASYDYSARADYFGLFRMVEGVPDSISRSSQIALSGQAYGAYLADQFQVGESTIAQLGLRWDVQNYGNLDGTSQLSPRISIAHAINTRTSIHGSIGRFYQAQGAHELQVDDGVERFFDAQRMDTAILGLQHRYLNGLLFRAEAYWKSGDRIRPRFENVLNRLTVLPEYKPDRRLIDPVGFRAYGMEVSLRRDRESGASWWATYVYSSADDEMATGYVPRSWDQTHALRVSFSFARENWNFGVVATGRTGWPRSTLSLYASDPAAPVISITDRNLSRYTFFGTLDMRVRYTAPAKIGELTYFFELSNATNRENPCCVDFDVSFDAAGFPVLEQETKYWLPLLPAVGVLWQF